MHCWGLAKVSYKLNVNWWFFHFGTLKTRSLFYFPISGIPFNQLPALEVDGKVIVGQSMAIARYVARDDGDWTRSLKCPSQITDLFSTKKVTKLSLN